MSQVSGPVIAVGLVLSAVFVPCAFISGLTGQFFRQFALTIAASTIISTFNSLTLSPALSAVLLRERDKETHEALPRLAFPVFGGWLGYAVACAAVGAVAGTMLAAASGRRRGAAGAGNLVDCRGGGGGRGGDRRMVDRPARRRGVAGGLPVVQRRLRLGHQRLHPRGRRPAARQRAGVGRLCRDVVRHLPVLYDRPQGVHPGAGHGLPVCRRAVARRGLDRTDAGRRGPRAADCDGDATASSIRWPLRDRRSASARRGPISA